MKYPVASRPRHRAWTPSWETLHWCRMSRVSYRCIYTPATDEEIWVWAYLLGPEKWWVILRSAKSRESLMEFRSDTEFTFILLCSIIPLRGLHIGTILLKNWLIMLYVCCMQVAGLLCYPFNFWIDKCRYVRCILRRPDGSICGKERRANAKAKARRDKTDYKCGDCLTWLLSQDTLRKAAASTRSANWNGSTASHDLWAAFDILGEGLQQEYTWSGFRGFTIHALFVLTEVPIPLHWRTSSGRTGHTSEQSCADGENGN